MTAVAPVRKRILARNGSILLALAAASVFGILLLWERAPVLDGGECDDIVSNIVTGPLPPIVGGKGNLLGTVRTALRCAQAVKTRDPTHLAVSLGSIYVGLQSFAVPGPLVLSIVAGALYGVIAGSAFVAVAATTGATLCYVLASMLMRPLLNHFIPGRLADFRAKIDSQRENLFWYLLFLRLTPFVPNWFINVSAPIIGIPLSSFVLSTAIGLVPANYVHTQTGATIAKMSLKGDSAEAGGNTGVGDSWQSFAILFALQFVALAPTMLKGRLAKYYHEDSRAGDKKANLNGGVSGASVGSRTVNSSNGSVGTSASAVSRSASNHPSSPSSSSTSKGSTSSTGSAADAGGVTGSSGRMSARKASPAQHRSSAANLDGSGSTSKKSAPSPGRSASRNGTGARTRGRSRSSSGGSARSVSERRLQRPASRSR